MRSEKNKNMVFGTLHVTKAEIMANLKHDCEITGVIHDKTEKDPEEGSLSTDDNSHSAFKHYPNKKVVHVPVVCPHSHCCKHDKVTERVICVPGSNFLSASCDRSVPGKSLSNDNS